MSDIDAMLLDIIRTVETSIARLQDLNQDLRTTREKSLAITKLQEARMWLNEGVRVERERSQSS